MGDVRLIHGDCLEVMPTLPAASVHSIVTDPPYGLEFMGKEWDKFDASMRRVQGTGGTQAPFACHAKPLTPKRNRSYQQWCSEWAAAALRVIKPGHYMLCFGGTRTFHRLACAIEDADWEIRDCIMWVYGSGFPKGKGCLKPAWEPILLARKPGPKVLPLQIDACRIPGTVQSGAGATGFGQRDDNYELGTGRQYQTAGRWPANVIHDGSEEVVAGFPQTGNGCHPAKRNGIGYHGGSNGTVGEQRETDSGSAARFFYCAKASRADRNDGLDGMPAKQSVDDDWISESRKDAPGGGKPSPQANHHPTVKPTALMRYLCRLITPPGGTILDQFCGSGSTGKAAVLEGFDFIGIEKEAEYLEIDRKRIAAAQAATPLFAEAK